MKTTEVAVFISGVGHLQTFKNVETNTLSFTPTSLNFKAADGAHIAVGGRFSYIVRTVDNETV